MSCSTYYAGSTFIHRLDPRPKFIITLLFSLLVALTQHSGALLISLGTGIILVILARLPAGALIKRLIRINIFMAVIFMLVPSTFPGETAFRIFSVSFSREGIIWSSAITIKANAIVLVFASLTGTVEPFTLGQALHHLRVPSKLTHLFLFTIRYLDVLHHEYLNLIRAMKARGFKPGMRLHTYRSYAYLFAMLLVRSLERSERIMAAMKCRGFAGEFHVLRRFSLRPGDLLFSCFFALLSIFIIVVIHAGIWRLW